MVIFETCPYRGLEGETRGRVGSPFYTASVWGGSGDISFSSFTGPINYGAAPGPFIKIFSSVPSVSCQEPDPYISLCREKDATSITDVLRRQQGFSLQALKGNTQVFLQGQFAPVTGTDNKMRPEPRTQEKEVWVVELQHIHSVTLRSHTPSLSLGFFIWITHCLTQSLKNWRVNLWHLTEE